MDDIGTQVKRVFPPNSRKHLVELWYIWARFKPTEETERCNIPTIEYLPCYYLRAGQTGKCEKRFLMPQNKGAITSFKHQMNTVELYLGSVPITLTSSLNYTVKPFVQTVCLSEKPP